jgi:hypothetical protein
MNFASFVHAYFLRHAGWPQKKGLIRKRLVVSAEAADGALNGLVEIGAGIGASDTNLSARLLANVFSRSAKLPADLLNELVVAEIEVEDSKFPYHSVFEGNFPVFAVGAAEVTWEYLSQNEVVYGILFSRAIYWGNQHKEAMDRAVDLQRTDWNLTAGGARSAGLNVPETFPHETNQAFYESFLDIVGEYEAAIGPLPNVSVELESELRLRQSSKG